MTATAADNPTGGSATASRTSSVRSAKPTPISPICVAIRVPADPVRRGRDAGEHEHRHERDDEPEGDDRARAGAAEQEDIGVPAEQVEHGLHDHEPAQRGELRRPPELGAHAGPAGGRRFAARCEGHAGERYRRRCSPGVR